LKPIDGAFTARNTESSRRIIPELCFMDQPKCPECGYDYPYEVDDALWHCPDCEHQWNPHEVASEASLTALDANGNLLSSGDSVIVAKDLPVKGAPKPIKAGTKVQNIRIVEGDHNIDCKIPGFGSMALKSEFVKKA